MSDWSSDVCSSDLGSDWRAPIAALETLYADYPAPDDGVPDFSVRLFARRPWRRFVRASVMIGGDYEIGRAPCRERVCQYVYILVVAVSLKKNTHIHRHNNITDEQENVHFII